MRPPASFLIPFLLLSLLDGSTLAAQSPAPLKPDARFDPIVAPLPLPDPGGPSWHGRLLSAVGGGLLGAGLGYFASQLFRGDWDDGPGRTVDRPVWAAVGGSIGLAVGFSFPLPPGGTAARPAPRLQRSRDMLDAGDWAGKGVYNALEAVRLLRPEWLRDRGPNIIGATPDETLQVYLDDVRLGGASMLRQLTVDNISSMRFFNAAAATNRWGAGNSHGAILVIARPERDP